MNRVMPRLSDHDIAIFNAAGLLTAERTKRRGK